MGRRMGTERAGLAGRAARSDSSGARTRTSTRIGSSDMATPRRSVRRDAPIPTPHKSSKSTGWRRNKRNIRSYPQLPHHTRIPGDEEENCRHIASE